MPKRRLPPAPKMWSHLVNGRDWEIYLTNGQTLRPAEEIDVAAARQLAKTLQVILISYGSSAKDLTGDSSAIAEALTEARTSKGYEFNTFHEFTSREGTRALVVQHHH